HLQLFVPKGFAHGFSVLENDTVFAYKCSNLYNKESEGSIIYNDPTIAVDWQVENPIISEKDQNGVLFRDFVTPFDMP
ncbi:MAG TPA: dTDP-4-dehydrorhamnose 3,5-epimerase, partial [Bacteroidales bacterium]|nr:dTDP-4-dehydrorhamnose 3,5-epimerase [Bacteroidales bacterium]